MAWFEALSILALIAEMIMGVIDETNDWLWYVAAPLLLLIILSISRRRSKLARWIYTLFSAFGLLSASYWLLADLRHSASSSLADFPLQDWGLLLPWLAILLIELCLLWAPATSRWMAAKSPAAIFE